MIAEMSSFANDLELAAEEFNRAYTELHPGYTAEEINAIRENSGLEGLVRGEDLPLGSLGLISERSRRNRARKIGARLGRITL